MRDEGLQQLSTRPAASPSWRASSALRSLPCRTGTKVPSERVIAVESVTASRAAFSARISIPKRRPTCPRRIWPGRASTSCSALCSGRHRRSDADRLSRLKGDVSELGLLHMSLAEAAEDTNADAESREFFRLFVGVGPRRASPLRLLLHHPFPARPAARPGPRGPRRPRRRAQEGLYEPEDHLGILFDVMAGLASRQFGEGLKDEKAFFHAMSSLGPCACSQTSRAAPKPIFYKAAARVGAAFVAIESQASRCRMTGAPTYQEGGRPCQPTARRRARASSAAGS